jgi:hypothetical protein
MALLAVVVFTLSYIAAISLRLAINLPRWVLLLLGSSLLTGWSFSAVFDAARNWGQDPHSWRYAWIDPGWLDLLLVYGGCLAGCILGGVRAMRRTARASGPSQPAA